MLETQRQKQLEQATWKAIDEFSRHWREADDSDEKMADLMTGLILLYESYAGGRRYSLIDKAIDFLYVLKEKKREFTNAADSKSASRWLGTNATSSCPG